MDDHRRLAALAVFRELYDSQRNLYDVLREFVVETIISQRLFSFSIARLTNELEKGFGIRVPEAVVRSVLKFLTKNYAWCRKQDGDYIIENVPEGIAADIEQKYAQKQDINRNFFNRLVAYINKKRDISLSEDEEKIAINSFCAFLLNERNGEAYSEYIGSFVLDHEDDEQFQKDLNEIREGVILYSGITYNDKLMEVGKWKNEMTFFLDQEILFHSYGMNGEHFKTFFYDLYRFVKEVNTPGKKLIRLKYFPETKDEIDSFFSYAERVVRNEEPMRPGNSAMKFILDGCQNASDVRGKSTQFYHYLDTIGIRLEEDFNFSEEKYPHNIISEGIYEKVLMDIWGLSPQETERHGQELHEEKLRRQRNKIRKNVTNSMTILNKIHCLRGPACSRNFYEVKYHFLTGTDITLKTAWHESIKGTEAVPLANSLDWVTNKFWFKLNKGFEGEDFPTSAQVLAKARTVLSTVVNRNVGEQYDRLVDQHKSGQLSKELVQLAIFDLMNHTVMPEDIDSQSVDSTLDFIQRDSLEHYRSEQEAEKIRQEKQHEENMKLRQTIANGDQETEKLRADLQAEKNKRKLDEIARNIADETTLKEQADKRCDLWCRGCAVLTVVFLILILYLAHLGFNLVPWAKLEPILAEYNLLLEIFMTFLLILGFYKLRPLDLKGIIRDKIRKRVYASRGVCDDKLCKLKKQEHLLKERLG